MDNSTFRKNVFKTLSVKPAKLGLRYVAKNTHRTNIMHAGVGIATEAIELAAELGPYLLGVNKFNDTMKVNVMEEMGDLGYYLVVLAKSLKVKLPTSSKKVRLKGKTRGEAVFELIDVSGRIGDVAKKFFYGPVMSVSRVDKTIEGKKVTVENKSINADETELQWTKRKDILKELLSEKFIPLYWALCYDLFDVPPSVVFEANISKLAKRYGEGFFILDNAENRDVAAEKDKVKSSLKKS